MKFVFLYNEILLRPEVQEWPMFDEHGVMNHTLNKIGIKRVPNTLDIKDQLRDLMLKLLIRYAYRIRSK